MPATPGAVSNDVRTVRLEVRALFEECDHFGIEVESRAARVEHAHANRGLSYAEVADGGSLSAKSQRTTKSAPRTAPGREN